MNFMPRSFLRLFNAASANHIEIAFSMHPQVYPQLLRRRLRSAVSIDRRRSRCRTLRKQAAAVDSTPTRAGENTGVPKVDWRGPFPLRF
jgi:hypothetical protein